MSAGNGNGRMLLDHKPPFKTNAQKNKEIADAVELVARTAATDQVREVVEYYFNQIPDLVAKMLPQLCAPIVAQMLAQAFTERGVELKSSSAEVGMEGGSESTADAPGGDAPSSPNPTPEGE